jgi:hypothetical protein
VRGCVGESECVGKSECVGESAWVILSAWVRGGEGARAKVKNGVNDRNMVVCVRASVRAKVRCGCGCGRGCVSIYA